MEKWFHFVCMKVSEFEKIVHKKANVCIVEEKGGKNTNKSA